jgi:hypothetical protein
MPIETPASVLSRRRVLAAGGAGIGIAALVAACGDSDEEESIPQTGEPAPVQTLPEAPVNDAVLLRTASSIVYSLIDAYERALATGSLDGAERGVADDFRGHAETHVDTLADATQDAGGEPNSEPNPNFTTNVIDPGFDLIEQAGNDPQELLRFLHALETVAAATQQGFVAQFSAPELRQVAMSVGGVEARHATVLSRFLEGTTDLPPTAVAPPTETTAEETTTSAAASAGAVPQPVSEIPSAFGSLSGVTVVLNGEELAIDTPGPNSYVY